VPLNELAAQAHDEQQRRVRSVTLGKYSTLMPLTHAVGMRLLRAGGRFDIS
jgi:hypothetical protein